MASGLLDNMKGSPHEIAAQGVAGPGGALPHAATIQPLFGRHDVSQVVAHTDPNAQAAARALKAEAYTFGQHVAFANASPGLHTAVHEAAHTVHQTGDVQLKAGEGQVGDAYERNADAAADKVVRGQSAEALLDSFAPAPGQARNPGPAGVQYVKKAFALYGTNGEPAESERQHYMEEATRDEHQLKVDGSGVFYQGSKADDQWSGSGRVQYVFAGKKFYGQYYGPGEDEGKHDFHTRYTAAGNVTCGGWMKVNGHALVEIGNDSGHYKPEMEGLYQMLQFLKEQGIAMDSLAVNYVTPENESKQSTAAVFLETHKEAYDAGKAQADKLKAMKVSNISFDKFGPSGPSDASKPRFGDLV